MDKNNYISRASGSNTYSSNTQDADVQRQENHTAIENPFAEPHPLKVKLPKSLVNYGSLLLENKGAVARDHLASERTFLAWLRTSLSLASVGVGVTQLLKLGEDKNNENDDILSKLSKGLGLCFILVALMTLSIGMVRYFAVQDMLTRNEFPASRFGVSALLICVALLSIAAFIVVLKL